MQIKMTGGNSIAIYATCDRLVVLKVVSPHEAEIVYDGPGTDAWEAAGKVGKNGQRVVRLDEETGLSVDTVRGALNPKPVHIVMVREAETATVLVAKI
nr:hypothetical protein [Sphingomonas oligophenolica]